jgi:hypothetical protein
VAVILLFVCNPQIKVPSLIICPSVIFITAHYLLPCLFNFKNLLPKIKEQSVIFLDAHWYENPAREELTNIKKYSTRNDHVIIIDDMDTAGSDLPQRSEIDKLLNFINPEYKIELWEKTVNKNLVAYV